MKLPIRLEKAITKLYNAFHNNELNAFRCAHCAVGNICNNNRSWIDDLHDSKFRLVVNRDLSEIDFKQLTPSISVLESGYSLYEISKIEKLFIDAHYDFDIEICDQQKKMAQFKGLCAVVEYLCELDGIPNVMDYTKLFETENEKPKYLLHEQL